MTRATDFIFSAAAALWAALLWAGKGRPGGLIIMKERGNRDVKKCHHGLTTARSCFLLPD